MTLFRYSAFTQAEKKTVGLISAESLEQAKGALRDKKIFVTKIAPYRVKRANWRISPPLLLEFTRGMTILLKAKIPLYDTLEILKDKHSQTKLYPLFLQLVEEVKHGHHLSEALVAYPKIFSPIYLSLVRSGEESGDLARSFDKLFLLIDKQQKVRRKTTSILIYPLFLAVFCIGILAMLFLFLIPSIRPLFESQNLHPMTLVVLWISDFLVNHVFLLLFSFISLLFSLCLFFRNRKGKRALQQLFHRIPTLKQLLTQAAFARFCRVLSILLRADVPLTESLRLSKQALKNIHFEDLMTTAREKMMEGESFSRILQKQEGIPRLVVQMTSIGEESGNLSEMMEQVSIIYEEDVDRSISRFTSLLQPALLLLMGIVVGVILLAILLPLTDMHSLM